MILIPFKRAVVQINTVLSDRSHVVKDLNNLVPASTPRLQEPGGINDSGAIATVHVNEDWRVLSFVLTPKH